MNHFLLSFLAGAALLVPIAASAAGVPPVTIQNVALTFDQAWEGNYSNYVTVFQDGPLFRMYYRGNDSSRPLSVTCYAESIDGIHWTKPDLGLFSFQGSTHNNIVWEGVQPKVPGRSVPAKPGDPMPYATGNFAPFKDPNPRAFPGDRYKAFDGVPPRAVGSPDGIHWHLITPGPIMYHEGYDSQNAAVWSSALQRYIGYVRVEDDQGRNIDIRTSDDFLSWYRPTILKPEGTPNAQLYTNGISFFGGYYVGLPGIFHPLEGQGPLHDGYFTIGLMVSRDGLRWKRFHDLVSPDSPENRNHGSLVPANGLLQTGTDQLSFYYVEHANVPGTRLRRATFSLTAFMQFLYSQYPPSVR